MRTNATRITPCHVRWMIRRDMAEVLDIENESFEFPWDEDTFIRFLRNRNVIGMVAEVNDRIVGFVVYELHKSSLRVLNLAVAADLRRQSIGWQIIRKLAGKLSNNRRRRITLEVRETNLDAQLFFRAMGFECVSTLRDFYDDTPEDAYLMQLDYRTAQRMFAVEAGQPGPVEGTCRVEELA